MLTFVMKFCVTEIVSSMLSATCHHPFGRNIVSPGFWMTSIWNLSLYFGYSLMNHEAPGSVFNSFSDLNVCGGNMTHRFLPTMRVFHADVPSGSMCREHPLRFGPAMIHRNGGRLSSPRIAKKSSSNRSGTSY